MDSSRPDASIVKAARAGDRDSFARLHLRYANMVHGILLARVPAAEADDLVQDVFLAALERMRTLREPSQFGSWLATIARNRATDFLRRPRKMATLPESVPDRAAPKAEAAEVLTLIQSLPAAYRETLVFRLVEGMTGPEIAEQTGLTAGSVRVNLHRGMKLLRDKLGLEAPHG